AAERARPAVGAEAGSRGTRTQVASAGDDEVETTASTDRAQPLAIGPNRSTTTPGGTWRTGAQPLPRPAQAYAGQAGQAPCPGAGKTDARIAAAEASARAEAPKALA
ncbi:D-alanyl-D-alanine carboxypeptidase, partial [Methylobacterium sp. A54F]